MAIHWDLSKVKDRQKLHNTGDEPEFEKGSPEDIEGDFQWAITNHLIYATISVGFHTITDKNVEEFTTRLLKWQFVMGASMYKGGKDYYVNYEDIHRRIGLSTNASPRTEANFNKMLMGHLDSRARGMMRTSKQKVAEEINV